MIRIGLQSTAERRDLQVAAMRQITCQTVHHVTNQLFYEAVHREHVGLLRTESYVSTSVDQVLNYCMLRKEYQ